jgi:hypothetical protein
VDESVDHGGGDDLVAEELPRPRRACCSARSPADSSPSATWPGLHRPKIEILMTQTADSSVGRTSSNSEVSRSSTPDAPPEVTRVVLTAGRHVPPSGGCDDEYAQAHSWGRV